MTEKEKMLAGKIYDPNDAELLKLRSTAHNLCVDYNATKETQTAERAEILKKLLPSAGEGLYLQGPVYFDYGVNTSFGSGCFANFNLTVLDVCPVKIGNNVFFGPNVSIYTPVHPYLPEERKIYFDANKGYYTDKEYGKPIEIGDDCWIAGNVVICGGVRIGRGCVIGAGSVVPRDIPEGTVAVGNPCRLIRKITAADSINNKGDLF